MFNYLMYMSSVLVSFKKHVEIWLVLTLARWANSISSWVSVTLGSGRTVTVITFEFTAVLFLQRFRQNQTQQSLYACIRNANFIHFNTSMSTTLHATHLHRDVGSFSTEVCIDAEWAQCRTSSLWGRYLW